MPDPVNPLALKKGDLVGHADDEALAFEVTKVAIDAGYEGDDEDPPVPPSVTEVEVVSLLTDETWTFEADHEWCGLDKIVRLDAPPKVDTWSTREQIADHGRYASTSFKDFALVEGDPLPVDWAKSPVHRWRFRHPDHGHHSFQLVLFPYNLLVTGDVGQCWWQREHDMLGWAKTAVQDPDYFAGKVVTAIKTREWAEEPCRRWLAYEYARLAEQGLFENRWPVRPDTYDREGRVVVKTRDEWHSRLQEDLVELENALDEGKSRFQNAVYESPWWEDGDYPDFDRYCYNFLWCRSAVEVALKLLGLRKSCSFDPRETGHAAHSSDWSDGAGAA